VDVQDAYWDHPRVAAWPVQVRQDLRWLWAQRSRLLAAAEATERTLCHLDVWPANLIDGQGRSVLLDWSFVGEGAVGEDVANLIIDSFTDGLMDAALLPEVAESTTDSYLQGLRDGGWSGPADRVRTAIAACGAA
jgi:thiamine kinase-like enzyme